MAGYGEGCKRQKREGGRQDRYVQEQSKIKLEEREDFKVNGRMGVEGWGWGRGWHHHPQPVALRGWDELGRSAGEPYRPRSASRHRRREVRGPCKGNATEGAIAVKNRRAGPSDLPRTARAGRAGSAAVISRGPEASSGPCPWWLVRMDVDGVWRKRWGDKNLANGDGGEGRDRGVVASTAPAWV